MKKTRKRALVKIRTIASLPSFWVAILILALSVISIYISKVLYIYGKAFESSVFSNIFAGLITGFIITVLSGTKAVYVSYMQGRVSWLRQTHEMILKHLNKRHELFGAEKMSDEDFFNTAYDAASYANHVNDHIMQSTFDKVKWFDPPKYCLKQYSYDCMEKANFFEELHSFLYEYGEDSARRKEVIDRVEEASHIMLPLNSKILDDITSLEVKIAGAQKSII